MTAKIKPVYNLNEIINISPNTSGNFDSMYNNEDILTYSEDQSQSVIYLNKNKNNDYLIDNKNQSLKNILLSQEEIIDEKYRNINNANNNINNQKDLSELQISLSNLLSDIDSKENIFFNNKNKNISNNNNFQKQNQMVKNNNVIDISNDISNTNEIENNNININNKLRKNTIDEQSSSVCNFSNSLYIANNNNKIKENNNINNNIDKILLTSPNKKREYQIEKGEN